MLYKLSEKYKNTVHGVKNIIFWLPIIWKDRWWDHSYIYSILKRKLEQMEYKFKTEGVSIRSKEDAKNMKTCILLLDRLIKEKYDRNIKPRTISELFEKEEYMINQDLDLLFKIMRKQIRVWWD
jgi:hypothetical protein